MYCTVTKSQRVKTKEKLCIRLIQENECQVQSIYLIYTELIIYTILNLVYLKEHMYYMLQLKDLRVDQ